MILHQISVLKDTSVAQMKSRLAGQVNLVNNQVGEHAPEQTIKNLVSVCKKRALSAVVILITVLFDIAILVLPVSRPWDLTLQKTLYHAFIGKLSRSPSSKHRS